MPMSLTDKEFEERIKKISDTELDNRIKQSNPNSNTHKMYVSERYRRAVNDFHNWGMHH
tara:strand:- start:115 stop:291 length:177 start_codon:yes stop_codon:yes gene_type:complete